MGRRDRGGGPTPIGEVIPEVVARTARAGGGGGAVDATQWSAVVTRWEEIAGPRLAAHAQPRSLRGGCLVVTVDHPAWATQMRTMGAALLERVGACAGSAPERLEVVVRPRAAPGSGRGGGGSG